MFINVKERIKLEVLDFRLYSEYYRKQNYQGTFLIYGSEINAYWQKLSYVPGWCLN